MRYVEPVYRPPSEAGSYLLQATIGCSWNHCTYCVTYQGKQFRVRPLAETLEDIAMAGRSFGDQVRKVFVLDGDALAMPLDLWEPILGALSATFPKLRRVSCYATALNLLEKSQQELERLRELGLELLYIGPESGDDVTLKLIAKGAGAADHVEAAAKARAAGMKQSLIFLLGAGGVERSVEHAKTSAQLATAMDPEYLSTLTLMLTPSTPIYKLAENGRFQIGTRPPQSQHRISASVECLDMAISRPHRSQSYHTHSSSIRSPFREANLTNSIGRTGGVTVRNSSSRLSMKYSSPSKQSTGNRLPFHSSAPLI